MSTTFAIERKTKGKIVHINVARRSGKRIKWINELAPFLNDEVKVIPIDNSAQGIFTIGDIRLRANEN